MAITHQHSKPSRAAKAPQIDTLAKHGKLQPRKNPYWIGVSGGRGGVSLGYRKGKGVSAWVVKAVIDGDRIEARLVDRLHARCGGIFCQHNIVHGQQRSVSEQGKDASN